jgi:hypothetical protein
VASPEDTACAQEAQGVDHMARVALTEGEVARILAAPKAAKEDVRWTSKEHPDWVGCELSVENQLKITLHIHANANLIDRAKYSFT